MKAPPRFQSLLIAEKDDNSASQLEPPLLFMEIAPPPYDKEYIKSWPEYWKRFSNDIMLRILIKDRGLEHGQRHGYVPHVLCCFDV